MITITLLIIAAICWVNINGILGVVIGGIIALIAIVRLIIKMGGKGLGDGGFDIGDFGDD